MKPEILEKTWKDFEKIVIPKGATENQHADMKKAFYLGAISVLGVHQAVLSEKMPQENGLIAIRTMIEEAQQYLRSIKPDKSKAH